MKKIVKYFLFTFLTFSLMFTTIAYAGLSQRLAITGEAVFRVPAAIRITKFSTGGLNGNSTNYTPRYSADTLTMGFNIAGGSTINYTVTVTNSGDIDQTIYDVTTLSSNNYNVTCTTTGYNVKDVIGYRDSKTFGITCTSPVSASNVNIVLKFNYKKVYHITYDANNGLHAPSEQLKYEDVDLALTEDEPDRTGYVFLGWSESSSATTAQYEPGDAYTLNSDKVLYAVWKEDIHSIVYDYATNGGDSTTQSMAEVQSGNEVNLNVTASKEGYEFLGWNTNKNAHVGLSSLEVKGSDDSTIMLYAIYSKELTASFRYYNDQSTSVTGTLYNKDTSVNITAPGALGVPSGNSPSYSFNGWSESTSANPNSKETASATISISTDKTYYASYKYSVTATKYTYNNVVSYDSDYVYMSYIGSVTGASINLGTASDPTGYTFRGWSESSNAYATVLDNNTVTLTENKTYYASYSYTVSATFVYHNGTAYTSLVNTATAYMNYNGSKTGGTPDTPSVGNPSGWEKRGWIKDADTSGDSTTVTPSAITGAETYYYTYYKDVRAQKCVYNNSCSYTDYARAYLSSYDSGTIKDASIALGAAANSSFKDSNNVTYTLNARGWSESDAYNATVLSNTTVKIHEDTTYYTSYSYTVTATKYVYNNSSSTATGTAYMTYNGTKTNASIALGSISNSSFTESGTTYTLTARGWSTSNAANATVLSNNTVSINQDTTYYASYSYTVTATKYVYNNSSSTATGTAYMSYNGTKVNTSINLGTTSNVTVTTGVTGTFRGWSTSDAANASISVSANENASIGLNTTYYASYSYTVSGTFVYYNGSAFTSTANTATAYMGYTGSKTGGTPTTPTPGTAPSTWTNRGWSTGTAGNSGTTTPGAITANTTYYYTFSRTAVATVCVYNNSCSNKTGATAYRSSYNSGNTYTNASIGLGTTSLSGYTFRGWSTSSAANASISVAANGNASIHDDTTYYASYSYTVTANFYYYNGSAFTSSSPTATAYMGYTGSKTGGTPTTPSVGTAPNTWTNRGWSTGTAGNSGTTTPGAITANTNYYYTFSRTAKATKCVYNNSCSEAGTGTAYRSSYNSGNTYTNASIGLGTTSLSGYTFRGWSTSSAANASISVAANGNASIHDNTTYYASYSYTVTANFYYYNGSAFTSSSPTATAYMGYTGSKTGGTPTTPSVGTAPNTWTNRGWSTGTAGNSGTTTPGAITANTNYYYTFSRTAVATVCVYNNSCSNKTGVTAYRSSYNSGNTYTNASIGLGTTSLSGYTFRGWSTSSAATASISVSANSNASIHDNTTFYASYTYTVTATFYYYNGSAFAVSYPKATAYMNYVGTKSGGTPTAPSVGTAPSGWTNLGWRTATSAGTAATPGAITSNTTYYYNFSKSVRARKCIYNNSCSYTGYATAYRSSYNSGNTYTNASISLGSISSITISNVTYTARGWSTSNACNASISVSSGGNASIRENTTYYASYKYLGSDNSTEIIRYNYVGTRCPSLAASQVSYSCTATNKCASVLGNNVQSALDNLAAILGN